MIAPDPQWYAVRVRSRFEKSAAQHLISRGYETFLPLYTTVRRTSQRSRRLQIPMFPGYLFSRFSPSNRQLLVTAPGVKSVVGFGNELAAVPEETIHNLQTLVGAAADEARPWPRLECGDLVRVVEGPLAGATGILIAFRGGHRLVVNIDLLQRSVATEVDRECVVRIQPSSVKPLGCSRQQPILRRKAQEPG